MVIAAVAVGLSFSLSSWIKGSLHPQPGFSETQSSAGLLRWKDKRGWRRKADPLNVASQLELKPPPYPLNALEPHMSQETLEYHWGKHHRDYVEKLNEQILGTELDEHSLEDIVIITYNKGNILPAFHNAAQIWNHEFFWGSMKPEGGGRPSGELLQLIERDFGSFEEFVDRFKFAAATQFGSGWTWLAYKAMRLDVGNAVNPRPSPEDKKLMVVKSPNAVNPLVWGYYPLLTVDVWEHAYYLDFQNERDDYISMFLDKLVSWQAVSTRLEQAKAQEEEKERLEAMRKEEEEKQFAAQYESGSETEEEISTDTDNDDESETE